MEISHSKFQTLSHYVPYARRQNDMNYSKYSSAFTVAKLCQPALPMVWCLNSCTMQLSHRTLFF